jgi:hypothetical protein
MGIEIIKTALVRFCAASPQALIIYIASLAPGFSCARFQPCVNNERPQRFFFF